MKMLRVPCLLPTTSIVIGLCFLTACYTNPETGRRQLLLIPEGQINELGITSFNEMKKELPINRDPELNAMVRRVGQRIKSVVDMPNAEWEFVVFDSKEANAFCLPGGKIGIYTGILPITKDEAGLATVMGHEVAHATARHGAERLSNQMLLQTGGKAVGAAVSATDPRWQGVASTVYGLGANVGVALPHSRNQEAEADRIGLRYMARAGYNPEAAVEFWQRFAEYNKSSGSGTPWFLRTHPLDDTRIQRIREWIPEAKRE